MLRTRFATAVVVGLLALLFSGAGPVVAVAQQITPAGYQAHLMRYLKADQAALQVRQAVAGRGEVLVDANFNRLLVRGPADVQQAAAVALAAVDRPQQSGAGPGPSDGSLLTQAYRIPAEQLEAAVADLRRHWPQNSGVRITSNPGRNEILVVAPRSVHAQVALRLAEVVRAGPIQANTPSPAPTPRVASGPQVQRNYRLRNVDWQQLEDALRKTWGVQLQMDTRNNGEQAIFRRLEILGGQALVTIDRRRNEVHVDGPQSEADAWLRTVQAVDVKESGDDATRFVPVARVSPQRVDEAISMVRSTSATAAAWRPAPRARWGGAQMVAAIFQPAQGAPQGDAPQGAPQGGDAGAGGGPEGAAVVPDIGGVIGGEAGFIGNVQIEYVEGLDMYIIRGRKADVDRVVRIIEEIERLSVETQPDIEILHLNHVNSEGMAALMTQVYDQILSPRSGQVSITPLVRPNAVLLIGRKDALKTVADMIRRLDQPSDPAKEMRVFQLRYMSSVDAEERINRFFSIPPGSVVPNTPPPGLATRVRIVADYRSNTLVVVASPRDMEEIATMLKGMDVNESYSTHEIKVFKLSNTLAANLAPVLQDAINGQNPNAGRSLLSTTAPATPIQTQPGTSQQVSKALSFIHVDALGGRLIKGGIMFDVKVVADTNTNSLIVTAPAESMELIGALIEQLDSLPSATAQIKVFTLTNGDATVLTAVLQQLFGQPTAAAGAAFGGLNQAALQNLVAGSDNSLIQLRFSTDVRTNSIIVTGSEGNINVVEALLARLDLQTADRRKTTIYRLKNAPAADVAQALNTFLQRTLANNTALANQRSPYELVEREIIIEPEYVSNSLIVSATPQYFEAIRQVIVQLDARPPMVAIQVVIAEVTLSNTTEFGVEFGLQESMLFDRGIADATPIRFAFNQPAIGNDNTPVSLATRPTALTQLLSNLNVGRTSSAAGFGGLVLSVGNDSVNALLRALAAENKTQILSRPQVMTLENQPAFVVVGQQVRFPGPVSQGLSSTISTPATQNVGIVLGVTPRTTPEGVVVMEIDVEKSSLGNVAEGTVIGFSATGEPLQVPPVNLTQLASTVRARSGQTVVLAGLISKNKALVERGLPVLKDIPIVGQLFRFNSDIESRSELLVIMTPYIVYEESEVDEIKRVETQRMNWSLEQVIELHGDIGVGPNSFGEGGIPLIYPDLDPTGSEAISPSDNLEPKSNQTQPGAEQPLPPPDASGAAGSASPNRLRSDAGQVPTPAEPPGDAQRSSRRPEAFPPTATQAAGFGPATPQYSPANYWQPQASQATGQPESEFVAPAGYNAPRRFQPSFGPPGGPGMPMAPVPRPLPPAD